ncbi:uncharacterized protein LOC134762520 [Penaeus indicus]|uniref:uncharacterized protein LOC134762520 n=1 Tax=Penaeus indicus TaxID=29960 RepID=UPI00300CFA3F
MRGYIKRQPAVKMERQRNGTGEAHARGRGALPRVAALMTVMATLMVLGFVSSFLSPNAEPDAVEGSGLEMPHVTQVNGGGLEMPHVTRVSGGGLEMPHVAQRKATQQRAFGSASWPRQSPNAQPKIVVTRSAKVRTRVLNVVSEALDDIFLNRSSQVQPHNSIGLHEKRIKNSSRKSYEQGLSRRKRDSEKYKSESQNQAQLSDNVHKPILVLELCSSIFKRIYDGELPPKPAIYYFSKHTKKFMKIFLQARFVDICLPLYRGIDVCKEMKHLTICSDLVVFLHTHDCQRPSEDDKYFEVLLTRTIFKEDYNCFQLICDGMFRIVVRNVSGITVEVWVHDHENDQCSEYYTDDEVTDFLADKEREVIIWTVNTFFPCCYSVHAAVWLGDPADRGINKFWDYLPFSCRVAEIALVCLVAFVGLSGALGNLLVVVVMFTGDDEGESCILRTSLAFADLFTSVFVILPSLFDHLSPILEIYDLKENYQVIEYVGKNSRIQFVNFADVYETKNSFRVFQGLVLGVCSFVSLFTLFMLSFERLILTGRAFRYHHYFSVPRIKIVIMITWITALLNTLTFMYDDDGGFTVTWSNIIKLPVSLSLSFSNAVVVNLIFLIQVGLLVFLCLGILFFSIASIAKFAQEQTKVAAGWRNRNMRVSGPFKQENRYILSTMVMMTLLFMISTVPKATKMIIDHTNYKMANVFLLEYLSWWMFVSGSAWNPWIYNMRSQQFKKNALRVLQGMIPRRLKERLRRPEAADRRRERERAQEKMLRRLGLVDDQS